VHGNRDSFGGSVSQDGRWVAFTSESFNLVPNDTNNAYDVFIRDRLLGTTEMVSVNDQGVQGNAMSFRCAISADGNSVSFSSGATNLVGDDTNGQWDVFVHDVAAHKTERVSVGNGGVQGHLPSLFSALSADGRYASFMSFANNFVPGDTNNQS